MSEQLTKNYSIIMHLLPASYALNYTFSNMCKEHRDDPRIINLKLAIAEKNTQHFLELLLEYKMLTLKQIANNITIQIEEFST